MEYNSYSTAECSGKLPCIPEFSTQAQIIWDPQIASFDPGADEATPPVFCSFLTQFTIKSQSVIVLISSGDSSSVPFLHL